MSARFCYFCPLFPPSRFRPVLVRFGLVALVCFSFEQLLSCSCPLGLAVIFGFPTDCSLPISGCSVLLLLSTSPSESFPCPCHLCINFFPAERFSPGHRELTDSSETESAELVILPEPLLPVPVRWVLPVAFRFFFCVLVIPARTFCCKVSRKLIDFSGGELVVSVVLVRTFFLAERFSPCLRKFPTLPLRSLPCLSPSVRPSPVPLPILRAFFRLPFSLFAYAASVCRIALRRSRLLRLRAFPSVFPRNGLSMMLESRIALLPLGRCPGRISRHPLRSPSFLCACRPSFASYHTASRPVIPVRRFASQRLPSRPPISPLPPGSTGMPSFLSCCAPKP